MLKKIFSKFFGSKLERDVKDLKPIVEKINQYYETYRSLSDEDMKDKTTDLKKRCNNGEKLEDILPEAYGLVKEACRRLVGKSWIIDGKMQEWNMIPYDVQLMGAVVLSQGKIAEMATGEGKTLVALFPSYLYALTGKGVHVVTVNDYLAKRDSAWMGYVHNFLGLTVGVITADVEGTEERKEQYKRDITYGVNYSFGFDYLRDNMVGDVKDMVQRGFNYCLIDEVDSVLIDDARTPLIISGKVERQTGTLYSSLKPHVFDMVRKQTLLVNSLVSDGEKLLKDGKESDAYLCFLKALKGLPRHKRLRKNLNLQGVQTRVQKLEYAYMRDKRTEELVDDLYYSIDEKSHVADLGQMGHDLLAGYGEEPDMFILPDISSEIQDIEEMNADKAEKEKLKDELHVKYADRSEKIHALQQLLRAYCLYERDIDYVVKDAKVIIVDQSTGRLKSDSRYSDGMHQAIEAKENVLIGEDTQTVATITYQNYFRLYSKLSGMTGTAITEENEFYDIYKLPVVEVPTNVPVIREDNEDFIYKTKKEKYNAIIEEIVKLRDEGRPVLVGTPDVDVSEIMDRLLKMRNIPHSLLNAKNNTLEAHIVENGGVSGNITIATNMAGRGTDIKLGEGVKEKGGLAIIGCERHNSRRIDRQLRGRAGRQGDPGSSRFYVSLEDTLMRLFGSERIASIMDKLGYKEGDVIAHSWISKSIERAQKRVEANHFGSRKHTIEYDDVMNKKREVVYKRRRAALIKSAISEGRDVPFARAYGINPDESLDLDVLEIISEFISNIVYSAVGNTNIIEDWDIAYLNETLNKTMLLSFNIAEIDLKTPEDIITFLIEKAKAKFFEKEKSLGKEMMIFLCKIAILRVIDTNWQQHLLEDEDLKTGISLMAHAQKDPLIEYKKSSFELFRQMVIKINQETLEFIFKARFQIEEEEDEEKRREEKQLSSLKIKQAQTKQSEQSEEKQKPITIEPKVGRNDPCPCGSGKKYKNCCGKQ